jgi:hypothetical protein
VLPQDVVVFNKVASISLYQASRVFYATIVMYADESTSNPRFTVKEAARRLNVSEAAIRQRIQRESINYEKDEESGRVYVILDGTEERLDGVEPDIEHSSERELIDTLQEQLRLEREASAELRRIIAGLTQRIPAIEAPPEEGEFDVSASAERDEENTRPEQEKRSFWQKLFGT